MRRLIAVCRNLLFRDRLERDLDDEVRETLDLLTEEKVRAGMTPEDARRAAGIELGSPESVKQQVRDGRSGALVDTLLQDARHGARLLGRQPLFTLTATLSLAIALGANTTIFSLASQLLFAMPSAYRPDRLVHIWVGGGSHVSHRQWRALEESRALDGLTGFNIETSANWRGPEQTVNLITMAVAGNFFDVVGVRWHSAGASPRAKRKRSSIRRSS